MPVVDRPHVRVPGLNRAGTEVLAGISGDRELAGPMVSKIAPGTTISGRMSAEHDLGEAAGETLEAAGPRIAMPVLPSGIAPISRAEPREQTSRSASSPSSQRRG
jgi:hypothetical protein